MLVYILTNNINGKVYIGQTIRSLRERWCHHYGSANRGCKKRLYQAIRKYGKDSFSIRTLRKAISREQLNRLEKYFIKEYKSNNSEFGYNLTIGGQSGPPLKRTNKIKKERAPISEETRLRMRNAKLDIKMKPRSPEACLNISKSHKGIFVSEKTKEIQRKAHKGKFTLKMKEALLLRLEKKINGRQVNKYKLKHTA